MRRRPLQATVGVLVLGLGGTVWYWGRPTPTSEPCNLSNYTDASRSAVVPAGMERIQYLDQGWTPRDSMDFYTRTQGSRLLPFDWFLALEEPESDSMFRDPARISRLSYLAQQPNPCNPDGLPVGFVRDPPRGGEQVAWLGFTCAACHTAELHYERVAYRIDGGPAMGDLQALLGEMTQALKATLDDEEKFRRFAVRLKVKDAKRLREQLTEVVKTRTAYEHRNRTSHPYGPARLDAFGRIVNQVLLSAIDVTDETQGKPPDAPVSYPFLWDAPHHDYVQWNGVARNRIGGRDALGGLARNVGEVLGVFGEVSVSKPHTATVFTGYDSSARIPDLLHLEELVRKLQSPKWPEGLPPIDEGKRAAGERLFTRYCSRCHADINRADPDRTVSAVRTPIRSVGTDPRMATNFAERTSKTGRLEGRKAYFVSGDRFGKTARADDMLVHVVIGTILGSPWKDYERPRLSELRDPTAVDNPDRLLVYKARPLNGIWATAPYLHNGSVSSLYQLLLPAEKRMTELTVGSRAFDPVSVGFRTEAFEGGFRFRTHDDRGVPIPGNSNAGHEYGAGKARNAGGDGLPALTDEERWQIVEYLKSL